jgi:hypothetical protein
MQAAVFPRGRSGPILEKQQKKSCSMPDNMERYISPRRGVASAWAMALLVFLAFAGFQAAASLRTPAQPAQPAGVVIPQHNERCADGQCRGVSSPFEHFAAGDWAD